MSPILTRPIREQLEHDRIIRQLQSRYKRRHDVAINPGMELNQSVQVGDLAVYPDLLLYSTERGRRLEGTVEVETAESVNQLEALAEWGVFSKLKAPFYLYVPPQSIESARRLCDEHQFPVAEIWTYHLSLDQVRFTQVYRSPNAPKVSAMRDVEAEKEKRPIPRAVAETLKTQKGERKGKAESTAPPAPVAAKPNGRAPAARTANGVKPAPVKNGVKAANGVKVANGARTPAKGTNGKVAARRSTGTPANGKTAKTAKTSRAAAPVRAGRAAASSSATRSASAKRPAARKRR